MFSALNIESVYLIMLGVILFDVSQTLGKHEESVRKFPSQKCILFQQEFSKEMS